MAINAFKLEPKPGFDWGRVRWTAPNKPAPDDCSYCREKLDEDSVPLRMWNVDGAGVAFCDRCMKDHWGIVDAE